jgi:hypothetical protein
MTMTDRLEAEKALDLVKAETSEAAHKLLADADFSLAAHQVRQPVKESAWDQQSNTAYKAIRSQDGQDQQTRTALQNDNTQAYQHNEAKGGADFNLVELAAGRRHRQPDFNHMSREEMVRWAQKELRRQGGISINIPTTDTECNYVNGILMCQP